MNRNYKTLDTVSLAFEVETAFLTGSLTDVPIEVQDVTVENYQPGFDEGGNDFTTIDFD